MPSPGLELSLLQWKFDLGKKGVIHPSPIKVFHSAMYRRWGGWSTSISVSSTPKTSDLLTASQWLLPLLSSQTCWVRGSMVGRILPALVPDFWKVLQVLSAFPGIGSEDVGARALADICIYKWGTWGEISFKSELIGTKGSMRRRAIIYGRKFLWEVLPGQGTCALTDTNETACSHLKTLSLKSGSGGARL